MKNEIKDMLLNWLDKLDSQIGDTEKEIAKKREMNQNTVLSRDDLKNFIKYIEIENIPESVNRALLSCLKWNPFTKK